MQRTVDRDTVKNLDRVFVAPEKGLDILLKAFDLMKSGNAFPALRLLIVGRCRPADLKKFRASLGPRAAAYVTFEPDKGLDELSALIRDSLCTVVPSRSYENLPNSVLESFACAKPVVATNIGSLPEVVQHGETGLLFEPNSADDLAHQLSTLASDALLAERLGKNARNRAEEYYSPAKHLGSLLQAFRSLR